MSREVVVSDVDQVIFPFHDGLAAYCNDRFGTRLTGDSFVTERYDEVIGCPYDEAVSTIQEFLGSEHCYIKPLDGVLEIVPMLASEMDLVADTSRNPIFGANTAKYIDYWLPGAFVAVVASGNKADGGLYRPKIEVCRALGARTIIDDSPGTVAECAAA